MLYLQAQTTGDIMTDKTDAPVQITFTPVTGLEWTPKSGGTGRGRPRSEVQQAIDTFVKDAYMAGPVGLECEALEPVVAKLERAIRSAGTHNGYGIRFGGYQASSTKGNV